MVNTQCQAMYMACDLASISNLDSMQHKKDGETRPFFLHLQRLIHDELILQRAKSISVLEADLGIRKLLARSVINAISQSLPITESQLKDF